MVDITAPDIYPVRDVLLLEDSLERESIRQHFLFPGTLPCADDDAALAVLIAYVLALLVERPMIRIGRMLSERIARRSGLKGIDTTGAPRFPVDPAPRSA